MLEEFLAQLDEGRREVFVLAELEQMTAPEIAEALALNINTVYSRLRAARQMFDRSFARMRLRDARNASGPTHHNEVVLLSRARSAYLPTPGAQARALALLAPMLLLPGAAQASSLTGKLSLVSTTSTSASVGTGTWSIWTATLTLVGVITASSLADQDTIDPTPALVEPTQPRASQPNANPTASAPDQPSAPDHSIAFKPTPQPAKLRPGSDAHVRAPGPTAVASPAPGRATNDPSPPSPVSPAQPPTSPDPLQREAALLAEARTALRTGDATTALRLLERHAHEFPDGVLTDERRLSQISALCLSGQTQRARAEARQLARQRPAVATRASKLCTETSATDAAAAGD